MIGPAISELLPGHECVIVPGLGGFITSFAPAHIDVKANYFMPPRKSVAFNAGLSNNDGILANHISGKYNISYTQALYNINEWAQNAKHMLYNGEELVIESIGTLRINTAGNLHFEPDMSVNYFPGSYGLPSFESPAIAAPDGEYEVVASERKIKHNIRHLVPATLKWAAVLAPLLGFLTWGTMNTPPIGSFINNQSGLLAWSNSTPGKKVVVPDRKQPEPSTEVNLISPAEVLGDKAPGLMPGIISYSEMACQNIKITDAVEPVMNTAAVAEPLSYHIVAGAFREISNANRLVAKLQAEGYPAAIADTNHRGLYVVSIHSFSSRQEAFSELRNIRTSGHPSAWVYKTR